MCGFAAILAHRSAGAGVDPTELARMTQSMAKRGPDGAGHWQSPDGHVAMGHRRLSIIDLSEQAGQPMLAHDGSLAIVFNGEIYNYRELRREMEAAGTRFRTQSDTEVLLELYRREGAGMLPKLRGMFAFALWDPARSGMLFARDPFGIKPLYVADNGKTVRAASQVRALLAGGAVDTSPDPAGQAGFLLWGHVPEPFTLYRGISALPAGSWLWADLDGKRERGTFFDFAEEIGRAGERRPGPDLRDALQDSVRAHLVADVRVGVFLSGGLDSTTLAALAAEVAGTPPSAVSLGFAEYRDTARDEIPLAEIMARQLGADHRIARITAADFAASRDAILADMDQPSIDGVNTWFVAREAARSGLKVALSGVGGDELFAGYDTFRQVPQLVGLLGRFGFLRPFGRLLRATTAAAAMAAGRPKAAGLIEYGTRFGDAYLLRRGLFCPWELPELLGGDMARAGLERLQPTTGADRLVAGITSDRLKVSALETTFYMRNQLLRDSDWAAMAHGVELRTPLVDVELFRAVLSLLIGGAAPGKLDMAACARPPLPGQILARRKTGFFVPIAQWMGERDLRGWAQRVLRSFSG
jgi:asparagine synthase (glutamine-hydrolysing)